MSHQSEPGSAAPSNDKSGTARNEIAATAPSTMFDYDMLELIRLLTSLARSTYTSNDGEQRRYDFGEIVCGAVTATAANLGSVDALLAGRPGSWEADYVRQMVRSSAFEDELHLRRTDPVRLALDPDQVFAAAGLQDLFDDADNRLSSGYHNGTEPDDGGAHDAEVDAKRLALEVRYKADLDAYYTAYETSLTQILAERGYLVPLELRRVSDDDSDPAWDSLAEQLHEAARSRTPLPTSTY